MDTIEESNILEDLSPKKLGQNEVQQEIIISKQADNLVLEGTKLGNVSEAPIIQHSASVIPVVRKH